MKASSFLEVFQAWNPRDIRFTAFKNDVCKEGSQFALTRSFLGVGVRTALNSLELSAEGRELGHWSQELIISVVCVEHEDGVPVFLREYLIYQLDIWEGEGIR